MKTTSATWPATIVVVIGDVRLPRNRLRCGDRSRVRRDAERRLLKWETFA